MDHMKNKLRRLPLLKSAETGFPDYQLRDLSLYATPFTFMQQGLENLFYMIASGLADYGAIRTCNEDVQGVSMSKECHSALTKSIFVECGRARIKLFQGTD